jgi:hypothetical protein
MSAFLLVAATLGIAAALTTVLALYSTQISGDGQNRTSEMDGTAVEEAPQSIDCSAAAISIYGAVYLNGDVRVAVANIGREPLSNSLTVSVIATNSTVITVTPEDPAGISYLEPGGVKTVTVPTGASAVNEIAAVRASVQECSMLTERYDQIETN